MKRKVFKSDYKAKVAIAALKGQQTTNEIAQEFGLKSRDIDSNQFEILHPERERAIINEKNTDYEKEYYGENDARIKKLQKGDIDPSPKTTAQKYLADLRYALLQQFTGDFEICVN